MKKIDFLYCVSHGFSFRMLTQTDLILRLSALGYKVGIISLSKNDSTIKSYCQINHISFIGIDYGNRFLDKYMIYRKYLLENISKNVALMDKHKMYAKNFRKDKFSFFLSRILYPLNRIIFKLPFLRDFFQFIERYIFFSKKINTELNDYKIDNIISTYPVAPFEACILNSAKKLNINTIIHLLSWDNITCKGIFPSLASYYIVWGDIMKNELIEYYKINSEKIKITGVPHFDLYSKKNKGKNDKFLENLGLNPKHPYLFFGMSSSRFSPNEIGVVEYIAKSIDKNCYGNDLQLIIRPHPQNIQIGTGMEDLDWIDRLKALKSEKVAIDFPDLINSDLKWTVERKDMVRLSHLISFASLSINSGSTITIDSLMCDTLPILTPFDGNKEISYWNSARRLVDFPHLSKIISYGDVQVANSFDELDKMINYNFSKKTEKKIKNNTVKQYCFKNDGNSTSRVIQSMIIINKKNK